MICFLNYNELETSSWKGAAFGLLFSFLFLSWEFVSGIGLAADCRFELFLLQCFRIPICEFLLVWESTALSISRVEISAFQSKYLYNAMSINGSLDGGEQ